MTRGRRLCFATKAHSLPHVVYKPRAASIISRFREVQTREISVRLCHIPALRSSKHLALN